jgi:hypothetical protein
VNDALAILGSLGGITAFLGAVWVVVRAVVRQSAATRDNTAAVEQLSSQLRDYGERIARLEGARP